MATPKLALLEQIDKNKQYSESISELSIHKKSFVNFSSKIGVMIERYRDECQFSCEEAWYAMEKIYIVSDGDALQITHTHIKAAFDLIRFRNQGRELDPVQSHDYIRTSIRLERYSEYRELYHKQVMDYASNNGFDGGEAITALEFLFKHSDTSMPCLSP